MVRAQCSMINNHNGIKRFHVPSHHCLLLEIYVSSPAETVPSLSPNNPRAAMSLEDTIATPNQAEVRVERSQTI